MFEFNPIGLFLFVLFNTFYIKGQEPLVVIPQGRVAGIKIYTKTSLVPVEVYFGIPYALPPTGKLRHVGPEPHPGWKKTLFAHRLPPRCPHAYEASFQNFVSEDCLYLNIWTPQREDTDSLIPVLVIFYSETWSQGAQSPLTCEEIAADGLVLITVAYRLHMLSFFTLETTAARGNLGLLDQHQALLWIKENIEVFGGDPEAVTVMGHSAGAESVLYHIVSNRSQGLFHRAIVMSPKDIWSAVSEKSIGHAQEVKQLSMEYAHNLACSASLHEDILRCLRSRPLEDILNVYGVYNNTDGIRPIPDIYLPEAERFIPMSLSDALSENGRPVMQLDVILGNTDLEVIDVNFSKENFLKVSGRGKKNLMDYAKNIMIAELLNILDLTSSNRNLLTEAILWEYWSSKSSGDEADESRTLESLARAQSSVRWGVATALLAARLARRVTNLYVYRYTQPGGVNLLGKYLNYTGAAHGTDLMSLLGEAMLLQVARRPPTAGEQHASSYLRRYIVNFVKYGSPSNDGDWPRYRVGEAYIHNLRDKQTAYMDQSATRDVAFWLQYLPHLANTVVTDQGQQSLALEKGDERMRGGVVALCGVTSVLLVLLCAAAALLRWQRLERTQTQDYEADGLSPQNL